MQIKFFAVPVVDGEKLAEELNAFLRSKKILQVERMMVNNAQGAYWCFSIQYVEDVATGDREKTKIDYMKVLDEATFKRFSRMRDIRKEIAQNEGIPPYNVFTNEELAELARLEDLTLENIRKVKGIGAKKVEKYGRFFISETNEKG